MGLGLVAMLVRSQHRGCLCGTRSSGHLMAIFQYSETIPHIFCCYCVKEHHETSEQSTTKVSKKGACDRRACVRHGWWVSHSDF